MNSDIYGISETGIFGAERLNFLELVLIWISTNRYKYSKIIWTCTD